MPNRERTKHLKWFFNLRRCLAFVGFFALYATVLVGAASAEVPPAPVRWMTDTGGLLSPPTVRALDQRLEDYQRQTGHQVVVWIGKSIGTASLDDFAVATFKAWGLGQRGKDDGVLVLVLAEDRRIAIEVGYGLEGQVSDAIAARIINDVMIPKLRANDPGAALTLGVDAILSAIEGKPFVTGSRTSPNAQAGLSTVQIIVLILFAVGFLLLLATHPALAVSLLYVMANRAGSGGGGGGLMGGGGRSGGGGAKGSW